MQEKMTLIGQSDCYQEGHQILSNLLCISINAMQLYRVTDTYGNLLEQRKLFETDALPCDALKIDQEETVYAMVDGSMLFTREEGWKEVKLGRVFKESDCMDVSGKRGWIKHSLYESYLGKSHTFTDRMDSILGSYRSISERLVFVADGARWIWKWVSEAYPEATQILDWYHALEHLYTFAKVCFADQEQYKFWVSEQKKLLEKSKVKQVLENIKKLDLKKKTQQQERAKLITYYTENQIRMDYKKYKDIGIGIIGSGAIEAANREVIQKRMKLSGQRWTKTGAQNMLTLRSTKLSGKWNEVLNLIRNKTNKAA